MTPGPVALKAAIGRLRFEAEDDREVANEIEESSAYPTFKDWHVPRLRERADQLDEVATWLERLTIL